MARCLSPGWYLFQYHRVLQYAQPPPSSSKPFFWMFVDNLLMTEVDHVDATRFLEVRAGDGGGAVARCQPGWASPEHSAFV